MKHRLSGAYTVIYEVLHLKYCNTYISVIVVGTDNIEWSAEKNTEVEQNLA
jgi:hypothetical protein